jgi:hypothetical protein
LEKSSAGFFIALKKEFNLIIALLIAAAATFVSAALVYLGALAVWVSVLAVALKVTLFVAVLVIIGLAFKLMKRR